MVNFQKLDLIATEIEGKMLSQTVTEPKTMPLVGYQKWAGGNLFYKTDDKRRDVSLH